jgi:hypothetical protein
MFTPLDFRFAPMKSRALTAELYAHSLVIYVYQEVTAYTLAKK